jgi:hypothetical protein
VGHFCRAPKAANICRVWLSERGNPHVFEIRFHSLYDPSYNIRAHSEVTLDCKYCGRPLDGTAECCPGGCPRVEILASDTFRILEWLRVPNILFIALILLSAYGIIDSLRQSTLHTQPPISSNGGIPSPPAIAPRTDLSRRTGDAEEHRSTAPAPSATPLPPSLVAVEAKLPQRDDKPVFEGLTRRETVRVESMRFLQALGYSNQAAYLLTPYPIVGTNPELQKIIALRRMALEVAKSVDIEILDSIAGGFGTHFRDEFIKGETLWLKAVESSSNELLLRSREASNRWTAWYNDNRERIEVAVNSGTQAAAPKTVRGESIGKSVCITMKFFTADANSRRETPLPEPLYHKWDHMFEAADYRVVSCSSASVKFTATSTIQPDDEIRFVVEMRAVSGARTSSHTLMISRSDYSDKNKTARLVVEAVEAVMKRIDPQFRISATLQ